MPFNKDKSAKGLLSTAYKIVCEQVGEGNGSTGNSSWEKACVTECHTLDDSVSCRELTLGSRRESTFGVQHDDAAA